MGGKIELFRSKNQIRKFSIFGAIFLLGGGVAGNDLLRRKPVM